MSKVTRSLFSARMLSVLLLGISSGLPLLLIGSTLKFWMSELKVDLATIGIFTLVGTPYTLKFLWAPLVDWIKPPLFGRRRGWIFISQILLIATLGLLAISDPLASPWWTAFFAFLTAFASATQDIAVDAYRREVLHDDELGLGSAMATNGYRIGMLVAGAGALALADQFPWQTVYFGMAGIVGVAMLFTVFAPDPEIETRAPATLQKALVDPFVDYFKRPGALEILVFILLYKMGDSMASDMFSPFYVAMGYSKLEVAAVAKVVAFWATIVGGTLGGILMIKIGMFRALLIFGALQAASTFGFALLSQMGHTLTGLGVVMVFENLSSGLGTAAYTGFIALLCNRKLAATQFALLSSLAALPRVFLGGASGYIAQNLGWMTYFTFCTVIAIPGLLMLFRYDRWKGGIPAVTTSKE